MTRTSVNREFNALGTTVYLEIITDGNMAEQAEEDIGEAESMIREKEKRLSRFDAGSELSYINAHLGVWHKASADILHLAGRSLEYNKESGGLFDPRIITSLENIGYKNGIDKDDFKEIETGRLDPIRTDLGRSLSVKGDEAVFFERMDFSGVAKGYICDLVAGYLKDRGWKDFLVDTGGDMYLSGRNIDGLKWLIDIEGIDPEKVLLELSDEAVATSGITRRSWKAGNNEFHHLINPMRPDDFRTDFLSVSVISGTAEESDVWAKILFLAGSDAEKIASENGIKAVFRMKEGGPRLSRGLINAEK